MSSKWKSRKLKVAALVFLMGSGATFASAQTTTPVPAVPTSQTQQITTNAAPDIKAVPAAQDPEEARLKKFLDKDGGYKAKDGGYYNPAAGTYTDKDGGIVDNWGGYTYKDGSYKSKFGDYWDAPTKTFKLATGEVEKSDDTSNADAIQMMRDTVEQNGGFDKDFVKKSMMAQIKLEHPPAPPPAKSKKPS